MYTHHIILFFNPIWIFLSVFRHTLTSFKIFFSLFKNRLLNSVQIVRIIIGFQKYGALWFVALTFRVIIISSTVLLTMAFFSCCLLIFSLGMGLLMWSLLGLLVSYLVLKAPRTLYSSEECSVPWMRQVFYLPIGLSTCRFLHLTALSPFSGRVHDETASPLFCLLWPALLVSARVFF